MYPEDKMMNKMAKVSIIVTIYNGEAWLVQCVNSLRNQTLKEIEIILVDDGSSDSSLEMCYQFAAEDDRISVIHQENMGLSGARNRGLRKATTEWIMFADQDDWAENDAVETLYDQACKGDYDIVSASYYVNRLDMEEKQSATEKEYFTEQDHKLFIRNQFRLEFNDGNFVVAWGRLYKRKLLEQNDLYFAENVKCCEDLLFNLYAFWYAKRVYVLEKPIWHYRIREGSISNRIFENREKIEIQFKKEAFAFLNCFKLWEEFEPYYNYSLIGGVREVLCSYSGNVKDYESLCTAARHLKQFCEMTDYRNAINSTRITFMLWKSDRVRLWLLKRNMYKMLILTQMIFDAVKK